MNKIILEIRAAIGGDDAKLLVNEMTSIYLKTCNKNNFKGSIKESLEGMTTLWIQGEKVDEFFSKEIGNHTWQRIPPTERNGRVQTSTVTVAVLSELQLLYKLNRKDVTCQYTCSGGKGGQNVNRRSTCVILTHIPTGLQVRSEEHRTQAKNEAAAWKRLEEKLGDASKQKQKEEYSKERRSQIGNGERSDKRRTYRVKDNLVIDHITNQKTTLKKVLSGEIIELH